MLENIERAIKKDYLEKLATQGTQDTGQTIQKHNSVWVGYHYAHCADFADIWSLHNLHS